MKRLIFVALAFVCVLSLVGCNTGKKVLEAWAGDYSEENLKNAIIEYQDNNYVPFASKGNKELTEVTFKTDYEISACNVVLPSKVKDNDVEAELRGGIYLYVPAEFNKNEVTISTGWWYESGDWTKNHEIWSYLVCVEDVDGNNHYYYFRTDYSA